MEKPILFSTPTVQAILEGRKTQTRRVVRPQSFLTSDTGYWFDIADQVLRNRTNNAWVANRDGRTPFMPCYTPGDVLWVRETWSEVHCTWKDTQPYMPMKFEKGRFIYKADAGNPDDFSWKPSIYMPHKAARIFLRVTDVRVERVNDISPSDCLYEGISNNICYDCILERGECKPQRDVDRFCGNDEQVIEQYADLWDFLYAKRGYGWNANPWVWVYEFERVNNGTR